MYRNPTGNNHRRRQHEAQVVVGSIVAPRGPGETSKDAGTNPALNWVLAAYQNPRIRPGAMADPGVGLRTISELTSRAVQLAWRMGGSDSAIAEDAVGKMFAALGQSPILENYDERFGSPRNYINGILARFVIHEVLASRDARQPSMADDVAAKDSDPSRIAEVAELERLCLQRLQQLGSPEYSEAPSPCSKASQYVRRYRARIRMWNAIADLFTGETYRPTRRCARS